MKNLPADKTLADLRRHRALCRAASVVLAVSLAPPAAYAQAADEASDSLQDIRRFQIIESRKEWTLYIQSDSLDVWRGNPPYEKLKTGHAAFALVWPQPVEVPGLGGGHRARSATIDYVFSCSPPVESTLSKVVFYETSFPPRDDSIAAQWRTMRWTVGSVAAEEMPTQIRWAAVFDERGRDAWNRDWAGIYRFICKRG